MSDGPVTEQHLDLLIVGRQVPRGVAAVFILPAPLIPGGSELVGSQSAAARREAAGDHNAPLPVPALVALQHLGMHCHVLYQAARGHAALYHGPVAPPPKPHVQLTLMPQVWICKWICKKIRQVRQQPQQKHMAA